MSNTNSDALVFFGATGDLAHKKIFPALQAPDAAARPHVHVMDPLRRQLLGAPDVVHIVRVAAVEEDVAGLEMGQEIRDG